VGIGGAGKTQLARHYIETQKEEYDTIFWLDARSKETARSSYEQCCAKLGLVTGPTKSDQSLEDSPAVRAVLLDLQERDEGKKWLVVVDNADDTSWVGRVVPQGKEGTVIVTSQDSQACRLLGGRMEVVKVDAMELEEAISLMSAFFKSESTRLNDAHRELMRQIVVCLDQLPLAVDLASARIRNDVEDGDDLKSALRQYLSDYHAHRNHLLRDADFANAGNYNKTIWTVWDTTLSSVRKAESGQSGAHATHLLEFLTLFDRANVQEELFRLASSGLRKACDKLNVTIPDWLHGLLETTKAGKWDCLSYRSSLKVLHRYGLIRHVKDEWKGVTMHSLVQWRAGLGMNREQYWRWYLIFLTAGCARVNTNGESAHFRRHLTVHLPSSRAVLESRFGAEADTYPWYMWKQFALTWNDEGRYVEAQHLLSKIVETKTKLLGEENPKTITSMTDLALCMFEQGLRYDAEELCSKAMKLGKQFLPLDDPVTLTSMHRLALIWRLQGRYDDATGLNETVLEARKKVLPLHDPNILSTMFNLASAYAAQKRFDEAAKLQEEVLAENLKVYGKGHVRTLTSMGNVARTLFDQGRPEAAENLEELVLEGMKSAVGENHPYTIQAMINLSSTYLAQGRTKEAETLAVEAKERCEKVLPPDNPIAVECRDVLDEIHAERGRREGAKGLETEILELSLEEHPVA